MNKIEETFSDQERNKLSVYFTAGFPNLDDTPLIMESIQRAGADLMEVGIPFSDPVADGATIQASNTQALKNGICLKKILEQVGSIKEKIRIPVILMGYLNPVYQYGIEKFCTDAAAAGVSGVIIPDLPVKEYQDTYREIFDRSGLLNIFLISPRTPDERIRMIDRQSRGFIYMVSASSTTGARKGISDTQMAYFKRIDEMKLQHPRLIGFGISDHSSYVSACRYAEGAIIGSAFIRLLENSTDLEKDIIQYIHSVKGN